MNTEQLTKLIKDCQAKLDGGTPGELTQYRNCDYSLGIDTSDGRKIICRFPAYYVNNQVRKANIRNIAAIYNGYRKQLVVALVELTELEVNKLTNAERAIGEKMIERMSTPVADFLGVEYE